MNRRAEAQEIAGNGREAWQREYAQTIGPAAKDVVNASGIGVEPLYSATGDDPLGYPGQPPYTRGIYATMHRGRTWTQRQLIGLGTPADYNARLREIMGRGASAVSLIPCNSVYRGLDMDSVEPELLGTCGTVVDHADHMDECLAGVDLGAVSCALNDPSPFTLLAFMLVVAERRGVAWERVTGTSNQSDYLSHCVANHMFFRLALPGARRVLLDHIAFCNEKVPRWNPVSVVGQHMQQAGATPAEAMAFALSSGVQFGVDCIGRGMDPDAFLPRFTFFFDISMSFFEEIAKLRAGRRVWARLARERLGAKDPKSWRFKFHAQTSGVDLTREEPLNNIARVAVQAMAGIFGGLQSLHTDAYDEVYQVPSEAAARIAVATQNILREEAHLTDVIDPLGGSHYVETLTDRMEEQIVAVMKTVDDAGGMYAAVDSGVVQRMIGASAMRTQERVERGEQVVVGVNKYRADAAVARAARPPVERPDRAKMQRHLDAFAALKATRPQAAVEGALDGVSRACADPAANVFAAVVDAVRAGLTNEEICGRLRRELGFGQPLAIV